MLFLFFMFDSMLASVRLECWQGTGYDCFRDAEAEDDVYTYTRILEVMSLHWHMLRGKCGASEAIYARPLSSHLDLKQKKDAVALHSLHSDAFGMFHEVHSFSGKFACRCSRT